MLKAILVVLVVIINSISTSEGCGLIGEKCTFSRDCCSGDCTFSKCRGSSKQCGLHDFPCTWGSECCSGDCSFKRCKGGCAGTGGVCRGKLDCCDNDECVMGKCGTAPPPQIHQETYPNQRLSYPGQSGLFGATCGLRRHPCAFQFDCCSKECNYGICAGCRNVGDDCRNNGDCCSNECRFEKCLGSNKQCAIKGMECSFSKECCSGDCRSSNCKGCENVGQKCSFNSDCCSGDCNFSVCRGTKKQCGIENVPCSSGWECCSGHCNNGQCTASTSWFNFSGANHVTKASLVTMLLTLTIVVMNVWINNLPLFQVIIN